MLRTKKQFIVDSRGRRVTLRGFNLGGWLLMESYILRGPHVAEKIFKKKFKHALGQKALIDFETSFRGTFIQELDFKTISSFGFNCVRIPFNHKLIETKPYRYSTKGLTYLKKAVQWAKKYKVWVILDLHAAPGCQNMDWHADSSGKALLWKSSVYRKRTIALWRYLAEIFKDEEAIAGYDLLNEPIIANRTLNSFYKELIPAIRSIDTNHILFIEPGNWSQDVFDLSRPDDERVAFSIHMYQPLDLSFNLAPRLRYPFREKTLQKQMSYHMNRLKACAALSRRYNVPILVGEFGVNARGNKNGEISYLCDILAVFKKHHFHWTYWTYKAVKNETFPDGAFHYVKNPPWVNREARVPGWENYIPLWKTQKKYIIASWKTALFEKDKQVIAALQRAR
ncbi:glycoside hydrolase family 5 protein [Candidatus Omnitrophota bacterium]